MKIGASKFKFLISIVIVIALLVLLFMIIPSKSRDRIYFRLKSEGYLDQQVDLAEMAPGKQVMIALTFGQSNSANSGESLYTPRHKILNYANGKLYIAKDPLLGTVGDGGTVWGILGDKLIDSGLYKKVIVVPIGIGSTSISCWSDSVCHQTLVKTLSDLKARHIKLTHIFWHQGESDLGTSKEVYKDKLAKIVATVRSYGQDAPFYCSIATYHPGVTNLPVSSAQKEFIRENKNVLLGPDTDQITEKSDRFQEVHFSASGMNKYADLWFQAIKQHREF